MHTVNLGELCEFVRGVSFDLSDISNTPKTDHVAILRAGNISDKLDTKNDLIWLPKKGVSGEQILRKDDIAICMSSGSSEVVGKTARVLNAFNGSVGAFCGIIRPRSSVTASYISHWLRSKEFFRWRDWQARGANIQNLRFSTFASLPIPMPKPDEQKRIAAILDKADRLRRGRRFAQTLSDSFLKSVFIKMFGKGAEQDWDVVELDSLVKKRRNAIRTGPFGSQLLHSEFTEKGPVAVLGIDNVVKNHFSWDERRFITYEKYRELKRYTVFPNDLLISIMATCGRCAIVPRDIGPAINTKHLCCITVEESMCLPIYLHSCLLRNSDVRRQLGVSGRGAIMPGLNMELIKRLKIPVPPLPLQEKFAATVQKFERIRRHGREANRQAEHLFQTLLQRAFRGEL